MRTRKLVSSNFICEMVDVDYDDFRAAGVGLSP